MKITEKLHISKYFSDSSQDILFENDNTEKENNASELPIRIRGSFLEIEGGNNLLNSLLRVTLLRNIL